MYAYRPEDEVSHFVADGFWNPHTHIYHHAKRHELVTMCTIHSKFDKLALGYGMLRVRKDVRVVSPT